MATLIVTAQSSTIPGDPAGDPLGGFLMGADAVYATAQVGAGSAYINSSHIEVGQYSSFIVYRSGLAFVTSTLGSGASITAAVLSVYGYADYSDTDFDLTIVSGADLADYLVDADYQDLLNDTISFGERSTSAFVEDAWFDIPLNVTGLAAISKTGTTRFGLRSSRDISATTPTGFESIQYETSWIEGWPATHQPKLTITYEESSELVGPIKIYRTNFRYYDGYGDLRELEGTKVEA